MTMVGEVKEYVAKRKHKQDSLGPVATGGVGDFLESLDALRAALQEKK